MNFEEFSIPQGKEFQFMGSWIPVTPQKPIPPRSNPIQVNVHGNQFRKENWQEIAGLPTGYVQDILTYNGVSHNFNQDQHFGSLNLAKNNRMINNIAGSYRQVLQTGSTEWNNRTWENLLANGNATTGFASASIGNGNTAPISNLHSREDNWRHSSSHQSSSSGFMTNINSFLKMPQYEFPIPSMPECNLNSQRTEVGAASCFTTSFQSMLAALNQTEKMENKQISAAPTSASDECSNCEKEKQENLIACNENGVSQKNCELLNNVVDSSSAVISAPMEEKDSERGSALGIDLNKTPQQKPPKRRKHRPKVIVEGKPKSTPKSAAANVNSKDNQNGKRKYVRKKGLAESATEHADSTKESSSTAGTPEKWKHVWKRSLKESANEPIDPANKSARGTGTTATGKHMHQSNQKESMILQGDCTRGSDPSAQATQQVDRMEETDPCPVPAQRSCRRVLNFDFENTGNGSPADIFNHQVTLEGSKSFESPALGFPDVGYSGFRTKLSTQTTQQSGLAVENQQLQGECSDPVFLKKMMPADYMSLPSITAATASQLQAKETMEKINAMTRNVNMYNADFSRKSYRNEYSSTQQAFQFVSQRRSNWENIDGTKELMFKRQPQSVAAVLSNSNEGRGSKRDHYHAIEWGQFSGAGSMSSLLSQGIFEEDEGYMNGSGNGTPFLQASKRKLVEDETHAYICRMQCPMSLAAGLLQTKGTDGVNVEQFTSLRDCGISNPQFQSDNVDSRKSGEFIELTRGRYVNSMARGVTSSKQNTFSQLHSGMEKVGKTNALALVQNVAIIKNRNLLLPTTPEKVPTPQFGFAGKRSHTNVSVKKKREPGLSRIVPSRTGKMLQEKEEVNENQQKSIKARGPSAKQESLNSVEEMINRFRGLTLEERNNKPKVGVQNALVVYNGAGTVVPYEGFELIKKRKVRPRVVLDPETNRVWNLLMGKEGEDIGDTEKDKEKWWEEERRVFRGRVDSFIARMHLVQGDRRFSIWKGSVVDSVIGVFLTQNVSDHLSSSAFMSLAAKFPLKSSRKTDCNADGVKILIEEPEVRELNPGETIKWHEMPFSCQLDSQSSMTPYRSTDYLRNSEYLGVKRTSFTGTYGLSLEEEVLSSQGSFESSVIQANRGFRTYSETEDPSMRCKLRNIHGSTPDQIENSASFEEFYYFANRSSLFHEGLKYKQSEVTEEGQAPRLERTENLKWSSSFNQDSYFRSQLEKAFGVSSHPLHITLESETWQEEGLEPFSEECMSSWDSTGIGFNKPKLPYHSGGKITVQHNGQPVNQNTATTAFSTLSGEHMVHQQEVHTKSNQLCNNHQEKGKKTFQSESASVTMPPTTDVFTKMLKSTSLSAAEAVKLTERTDVERMTDLAKGKAIESREVQSDAKELMHSSENQHGENSSLKPKRRKAQEEKNNATDWDQLRKQVQANGLEKERSKDTMDSMDYEAMRKASVDDISNTIKERGMNNMLAERIKDFLDRLVREHKRIDLEWLRDVPPGKAKDYLLSIWGLGLKSVECVRLLTLHHLAFPVDTNVGRIAVRLGWVPLQPLPESLQLHLLELYPILESIQKYLWPRLCRLDQTTLYELHYQMITFGKVFCTKSKPNCNACPMRGECRHFASAFASARLALPGPEEKSIASPSAPMMPEGNLMGAVNQIPLPPPVHNLLKVGSNGGNSEPIIEEPATPELEHTEVTQSDIEDAFYEDPDEIPTIKLNMEEFTANLQHYMQENMELQEGDLSKALVALNPEAASISTPKLKNVSRLRTEHYVYELPDTHPLLTQMKKREPDDPSPYLLAIWTPGETAHSFQPTEQSCGSQERGRLCSEKTCFACNSVRETNAETVRGTILIPCRTAMRGSFPLNGTYFQVNEVFADHESSLDPIDVPRGWIWNLPRRTVYFGTSVSSIFKGLSTEGIQYCFWKGFVCVRGFDQKTRAPRPLMARLHFPASKLPKMKTENKK
ncbi:transcriptional activator DEMETER-like [Hibiscus syriacus]|uniref:transcriptional activator DEMETER-like n=1 Tax=Hibiscus syriacus TaxID=106335 RepID=UPI001924CF96|nr:transcriptional activator DEMETER-like [Hibiscus syriacus]